MTIRYFAGGAKRWAAATLVICAAMAANAQSGRIHTPTHQNPAKIAKGTPTVKVKVDYDAGMLGMFGGPFHLVFAAGGDQVLAKFENLPASATGVEFEVPTSSLGIGQYDLTMYVQAGSIPPFRATSESEAIQVQEEQDDNQPPVVDLVSPNIDLGQVVGCLGQGDGDGLGKQLSTEFRIDGATVKLAVLDGAQPVAEYDIAKVSDPDGDEVSVVLNSPTTGLTFTGPGFDAEALSVEIVASDLASSTVETWSGEASGLVVYGRLVFGSPVANAKAHKLGSTLPVKFTLEDGCGTFVTDANLAGPWPKILLTDSDGYPVVGSDFDAGKSNRNTLEFRFDPASGQWIFNLNTRVFGTPGTYLVVVDLGDETVRTIPVTFRK